MFLETHLARSGRAVPDAMAAIAPDIWDLAERGLLGGIGEDDAPMAAEAVAKLSLALGSLWESRGGGIPDRLLHWAAAARAMAVPALEGHFGSDDEASLAGLGTPGP